MMEFPFKKGTRVRMTEYGLDRYSESENNPKNVIGEVIGDDGVGWVYVNWGNKGHNSYEEGTIEPVRRVFHMENK